MFDWDHLRTFLAVAREGNLSSAARALGVTQTTMGRRLEALHSRSGVRLLHKTPEGYMLTAAGERIPDGAERMETEALFIERAVVGEDERLAGEVRITTVEAFGASVVVPMLAPLLARHADLRVELVTDYRTLSLTRREADIAIRLADFAQQEVSVTRVGGMAFGLFASRTYLEVHGPPDLDGDGGGHRLVSCQRDLAMKAEATRLVELLPSAAIVFRANSRYAQVEMVRAGVGIGLLPWYLASGQADLVEFVMPGGHVMRGLWLGIHRDSGRSRRIRLVAEHLAEALREWDGRMPSPPCAAAAMRA